MNEQPTLQTIGRLIERAVEEVGGLKAEKTSFESSFTELKARVHDVEAGFDRLEAGG
jgi:hypothetical protein